MDIIKISALGICGVIAAGLFRSGKAVFGTLISMATCLGIFTFIISRLGTTVDFMKSLTDLMPMEHYYFELVIKMIGITYISEFAAGLCRDSGHQEIAVQIELFAKLSILIISIPVFMTFVETIGEFL